MEKKETEIKEEEEEEIAQIASPPSGHFKLYDQMELLKFQDKYVIRTVDSSSHHHHGFSINRSDGIIQPLTISDDLSTSSAKIFSICGVVGTINLVSGMYLLVITSSKQVGNYLGFPIFRVESMKYFPCNRSIKQLTAHEKKDEAYFRNLLSVVESTPGLYYSYETDITVNLQRRSSLMEGWMSRPLWKQADPRFVWNKALLDELIECKLDGFVVPLMQGSFKTAELSLKDATVTVTVISRRCTRRLGTRMWRRGANLEGNVANFIETEQLMESKEFRFSFLQVRGSIPLLWEQIVDLRYKPGLNIIKHDDTPKVVERHFLDLSQRYGEIMAVDLTDKVRITCYLMMQSNRPAPMVRECSFCATANLLMLSQ